MKPWGGINYIAFCHFKKKKKYLGLHLQKPLTAEIAQQHVKLNCFNKGSTEPVELSVMRYP